MVDDKVTLNERYDFFLVSQKTSQGTVSPTSYNIVEDNTGIKPDIHQRLANSLTDLYWNWPVIIKLFIKLLNSNIVNLINLWLGIDRSLILI